MLPASPAQQLSTKSWVLYSCAHMAPGSAIASHSASVLSSPGSSCWASCCPPRCLPQALHLSMPYWSPLTFLSNVKVITGIKATQCWWRRCQTHRVLHSMDPEPSVLGEAQNGWVGRVLKGHRSTGWVGRVLKGHRSTEQLGWKGPYRSQKHTTVGLEGSLKIIEAQNSWAGRVLIHHRNTEWLDWKGP